MGTHPIFESDFDCLTEFERKMSDTETEIELEETCWCTITVLISFIIAAFSYRFFGPENPNTSKNNSEVPENKTQDVYVQEIKRETTETIEPVPVIEKPNEVEAVPLNESTESAGTHSRESSSGPEFEIIDASDVPSTNEIELSNETPQKEEKQIETPTEETREEELKESGITDVDIELVSSLQPEKTLDDEPQIPMEDVEETEAVPAQEDEIVPIDANKVNLERYEDEIMQGNFADQTLFTPAKPSLKASPVDVTNDTLQELELDQSKFEHSDLNLTDDLLASPEKSEKSTTEEMKIEDEELDTPNNDEVSFENIPVVDEVTTPTKSESPDPIIAQQEMIPQVDDSSVENSKEAPEAEPSSEPDTHITKVDTTSPVIQTAPPVEEIAVYEPKNIENNENESPMESPEPDEEEIIEENVITDTDSVKNDISESDIRKVAENLIDQTLDNVEQKLKTDSIAKSELGDDDADASTEAEVRAKQLAEIESLMKEKGMGDLDPEQTKMYLE